MPYIRMLMLAPELRRHWLMLPTEPRRHRLGGRPDCVFRIGGEDFAPAETFAGMKFQKRLVLPEATPMKTDVVGPDPSQVVRRLKSLTPLLLTVDPDGDERYDGGRKLRIVS
ncbi:uncharacterized protein MELLADRAFT_100940 [Melampsora larici-populina 98AG31]|uniref:Uncharacterized protein n=1 Tax=Melampsora larici-populina (strain 98AG31 / pathotype 3-4-7) TaxID=747676 RepID=F4R329_MELLP|nr:uncharacterized protein MELLADRAFT_100940 [Melampsora larici-populina 98AG31]EGG12555.1 hypothetical protein MELLADRAFT_100940 [Melampsora larici-populina 98AG31]